MLIFEKLTAQHLRSNSGFEVYSAGRFVMAYVENNKKISITLEYGETQNANVCVTVQPNAFLMWDDGSSVGGRDEQLKIEKNFRSALNEWDI